MPRRGTARDLLVRIALAGLVLIGFGMASAHMLTDGDCETARLGPLPDTGRACVRSGGTWNPSTGFWHVAYEFGHIAFWPLIILLALVVAVVVTRLDPASRPRESMGHRNN